MVALRIENKQGRSNRQAARPRKAAPLPRGTVTFFLTSLEMDGAAWERVPRTVQTAIEKFERSAELVISRSSGTLLKRRGADYGLFAVFARASDAVSAACVLQREIESVRRRAPFRVRMALNSGEAQLRDGDYFGGTVNRSARLRALAYGGQILLTLATEQLVRDSLPNEVSLQSLGVHRLRDLSRPEQVFQVCHPELPSQFPALRSVDLLPNNLPHPVTSFIGREEEIAEIKRLLGMTRLLTLTGSAGCGKTRLALQVAADCMDQFPDGVWLVELAGIADPGLIPNMVGAVVGAAERKDAAMIDALADQLRLRHMLLILDNCEHVVSECAQLTIALLRTCPRLTILSTSREILYVSGETTWRVPSLSLPDRDVVEPAELERSEAIRLFVERAVSADSGFRYTPSNSAVIAQICRRLDGIPLAIELAAARTKVLSPEQIASRLDDRFKLLTGGSRTALPRQQTLLGAVDWSYELLAEPERVLLNRVSVFLNGFNLELAEEVCGDFNTRTANAVPQGQLLSPSLSNRLQVLFDLDTLDLLSQLVDKSLVMTEEHSQETRYRLLETIREYAVAKLRESGEAERIRDRHLKAMAAVAIEAEPGLLGSDQKTWLDRLEMEHDNLRAALEWARVTAQRHAVLEFIVGLWRFWFVRGYLTEARGWIDTSFPWTETEGSVPLPLLSRALNGAGSIAWRQGDTQTARAYYEESLTIRRSLGDRQGIANSLNNLGLVAREEGDVAQARRYFEEALVVQSDLGNRWGVALVLSNIGSAAIEQRDLNAARDNLDRSLPLWKELGDTWGLGACYNSLGNLARIEGDYEAAEMYFQKALELQQSIANTTDVLESLTSIGLVAAERKEYARALRLFAATRAARKSVGAPGNLTDVKHELETVDRIRREIGAVQFETEWRAGENMRLDLAVAYALER